MSIILKLFIIIIISLINSKLLAANEPIIITSITPLASVIKLIVGDEIKVESLAGDKHSGCAHHHSFKISDISRISNANLAIFIDEEFDYAASKMIMSHRSNYLKVSDLIEVKNNNWHFWLDLDLTEQLINKLTPILIDQFPELKNNIEQNLLRSLNDIMLLKQDKVQKLSQIGKVIITDESIEYLFNKNQCIKFYLSKHTSPSTISKLKKLIKNDVITHVIITQDQSTKIFDKITLPIVQIETENWHDDYIYNYQKILDKIK